MKHPPSVAIGILTYNSQKYLKFCFDSLLKQDFSNFQIYVLDNNSTDQTVSYIQTNYPQIKLIQSSKNLGFGKGHNKLIRETPENFYCCLNIDMFFKPDFISELVKTIQNNSQTASVTGKLKRWDFINNQPTNLIDTVGLGIKKSQQFFDLGQGEEDQGQFDSQREIFGSSGAAVLFDKKYLKKIAFLNNRHSEEYFDENMFMYKEDLDLAYRLRWAGFKCYYTPLALAYHDRTASHGSIWNRKQEKSHFVRSHSLTNQLILEQKHTHSRFSWKIKIAIKINKIARFIFINLLERDLLPCYKEFKKLKLNILNKKNKMSINIQPREIEKFMK